MDWGAVSHQLVDRYSVRARLIPGLMLILPLLCWLISTYGPDTPLLTSLLTLFAACGAPFLLSNFVRTYGLKAQSSLIQAWGGMPTTLILRHKNTYLPTPLKKQRHSQIEQLFSIKMPSPEEELESLQSADEHYRSATQLLIAATRDTQKFPLVFKELISYGFNRNCFGVRWFGCTVALAVLGLTGMQSGVLTATDLQAALKAVKETTLGQGLTATVSTLMAMIWIAHFSAKTVSLSGYSYAERLLESLTSLSNP